MYNKADFILKERERYDYMSVYPQLFYQTYLMYMVIKTVQIANDNLLEDNNLWDFCDDYIQNLFDEMDYYLMKEDEYFTIE